MGSGLAGFLETPQKSAIKVRFPNIRLLNKPQVSARMLPLYPKGQR